MTLADTIILSSSPTISAGYHLSVVILLNDGSNCITLILKHKIVMSPLAQRKRKIPCHHVSYSNI